MSFTRAILMRAFGRPKGLLGRLGGRIMARTNRHCGAWVADLLEVGPGDRILEVGFGPGVVVQHLTKAAPGGWVGGVDPSPPMLQQARARNAEAIRTGRVDLRSGSADSLPFFADSVDKALAINSMQVWPDARAGLREMRRVLKPGGRIALGFTRYSGQKREGVTEALAASGFTMAHLVTGDDGFCALATKPASSVAQSPSSGRA